MTDTPRTDAEAKFEIECAHSFVTCVPASFARELERELAAEKAEHKAAASFAVGMDHANAGLMADLEDAREQLAAAQKDTSNMTDTLKLCNAIESHLNATISPAVMLGRDHLRDLIAAARREAKLRDLATELLEVADLRGDSSLPHPSNDPITWTARMQDAWDALREFLESLLPKGSQ